MIEVLSSMVCKTKQLNSLCTVLYLQDVLIDFMTKRKGVLVDCTIYAASSFSRALKVNDLDLAINLMPHCNSGLHLQYQLELQPVCKLPLTSEYARPPAACSRVVADGHVVH